MIDGAASSLGLTKGGVGALTLIGTNSYSRNTIDAGGGALTEGGILGGQMTVSASTLNPGTTAAPGTLKLNATTTPFTTTGASTLNFRLTGLADAGAPPSAGNDFINAIAGPVNLSTNTVVNFGQLDRW